MGRSVSTPQDEGVLFVLWILFMRWQYCGGARVQPPVGEGKDIRGGEQEIPKYGAG